MRMNQTTTQNTSTALRRGGLNALHPPSDALQQPGWLWPWTFRRAALAALREDLRGARPVRGRGAVEEEADCGVAQRIAVRPLG